jgi:hypothetical protein
MLISLRRRVDHSVELLGWTEAKVMQTWRSGITAVTRMHDPGHQQNWAGPGR